MSGWMDGWMSVCQSSRVEFLELWKCRDQTRPDQTGTGTSGMDRIAGIVKPSPLTKERCRGREGWWVGDRWGG